MEKDSATYRSDEDGRFVLKIFDRMQKVRSSLTMVLLVFLAEQC